jgi:hypothetical protein
MDNLTFSAWTKPFRSGVYRVRDGFSFWTGTYWGCTGSSPDNALEVAHIASQNQLKEWSGLSVLQYANECHRMAIIGCRKKIDYELMRDIEDMQRAREKRMGIGA